MRLPRMYTDLAPWWPLLSPPTDYAHDAAVVAEMLDRSVAGELRSILELGSGGGHTASHLTRRFTMTLVDLSPDMLAMSEALNPGCAHVLGDMRSVRLEAAFDAVLLHDAVMYMQTEDDLAAAMATAAHHLRPGGAVLAVPDDVAETYRPGTQSGGSDGGDRSIRYLEWSHPPEGTVMRVTYFYALREGDRPIRVESEEHRMGLFPEATWLGSIRAAGLDGRAEPSTLGDAPMFVGVKP